MCKRGRLYLLVLYISAPRLPPQACYNERQPSSYQRNYEHRSLSMEARTILLGQDCGILTITLNRPEILNALDLAEWQVLTQAFEQARDDPTVRTLIIT